MQNDIGAARRFADRGMVERVDLDDLGVGRRAGRAARPHQARHGPASVAEHLRRRVTEPPGGAEHQNTRTHDRRRARGKSIRVHPAGDAMVRAVIVISNPADLNARRSRCRRQLKIGEWCPHILKVIRDCR
jgi:hypothetical protein